MLLMLRDADFAIISSMMFTRVLFFFIAGFMMCNALSATTGSYISNTEMKIDTANNGIVYAPLTLPTSRYNGTLGIRIGTSTPAVALEVQGTSHFRNQTLQDEVQRSEERRVGKEC